MATVHSISDRQQHPDALETVSERVTLLVLSISSFGNQARLKNEGVSVLAEDGDRERASVEGGDMVRLSKRLLDSEELRAVRRLDGDVKTELLGRSRTVGDQKHHVPGAALPSLVRDGIVAVPTDRVSAVDERVRRYVAERAALIDAFLETYPARVAEARERLGDNWSDEDYPSERELRRRFKVRWRWVQLGVPTALRSISDDLYQEARRKAAAEAERFLASSRALLRGELLGLLSYVGDLLAPRPDGTRKCFRDSVLPSYLEALKLIRSRDVADDADLRAALDQSERLAMGFYGDAPLEAAAVREHDALAEQLAARVGEVRKQVERLVAERPARAIDLDD